MKKVVCIKNQYDHDKPNWDLTIGKSYEVYHSTQYGWYFLTNDIGQTSIINNDWFIGLSEYRDYQLNKLGI